MKLTLNIQELTDDFFTDTMLLGIMAAAKSYRFCWQLNSTLGFNFRLNTDIDIHVQKKGRHYFFPVYHYHIDNTDINHYVYQNQYDGEYLLSEFKHMDFLWLIKSNCFSDKDCKELIQNIRSMNGVQLITELTNEQIKNKGNLIF